MAGNTMTKYDAFRQLVRTYVKLCDTGKEVPSKIEKEIIDFMTSDNLWRVHIGSMTDRSKTRYVQTKTVADKQVLEIVPVSDEDSDSDA